MDLVDLAVDLAVVAVVLADLAAGHVDRVVDLAMCHAADLVAPAEGAVGAE